MGVNQSEEQGPKRSYLSPTRHMHAAGAEWSHQTEVGTREGEDREKEGLLGPVRGEGGGGRGEGI